MLSPAPFGGNAAGVWPNVARAGASLLTDCDKRCWLTPMPTTPPRPPRTAPDRLAATGFDLLHVPILRGFAELVLSLGGDPGVLLRGVGLDPEQFTGEAGSATYRQFVDLLEDAADALGCPDFGIRLGILQGGSAVFGALGHGMRNAGSLGEALDFVSRHAHAQSLAAGIWQRPLQGGDMIAIGHEILAGRIDRRAQAVEQHMMLGKLAAAELTGGIVRARQIWLRHQPVSALRAYRRHFGCEVRFGQPFDATVYAREDLDCPLIAPDREAFAAAAHYIDTHYPRARPPLHALVRSVVLHFLGSELCRNGRVAAELGLHPRTMLRGLAAEGTSFQKIKDEVRRELMAHYLRQTDLPVADISERLGFAEQSVMSRTCRGWFGVSPSQLRRRQEQGPATTG